MRVIDRFAGIPLCWATGVWLKLFRSRQVSAKPTSQWQNILVMKFFGMGSILLSTPFLAALRRHNPRANIVYLTFTANRELLEKLPQPDLRLTISTHSPGQFIADTFTALTILRQTKIDVVFDLEFFSKFSTLLSVLSGASLRVGYTLPTRWRKTNLTHPVALDHSSHVTDVFLRQLSGFGIATAGVDILRIEAEPHERISMERKLGLASNGFETICVNINSGTTSLERRWPYHRFAEVALHLLRQNKLRRFFFIGSSEEREYVQQMLDSTPALSKASINCAGTLTIGELIALFERSSFLLTNDSGPMHIAAFTGTPVVALFGPESPRFYGPRNDATVVYKAIACSPCLNMYNAKMFVCPYNARCMKEIRVQDVLKAIEEVHTHAHARHG